MVNPNTWMLHAKSDHENGAALDCFNHIPIFSPLNLHSNDVQSECLCIAKESARREDWNWANPVLGKR